MQQNYNENMENKYQPMISQDDGEMQLYPEVYKKLIPYADQLISDMERTYGNIELTDDLLNQMTNEVIQRSGIPIQSETAMLSYDAIPTINNIGGGYRGNYHNRSSLNDILRIILLQQLFGSHRRPRWTRRYR